MMSENASTPNESMSRRRITAAASSIRFGKERAEALISSNRDLLKPFQSGRHEGGSIEMPAPANTRSLPSVAARRAVANEVSESDWQPIRDWFPMSEPIIALPRRECYARDVAAVNEP